MVNVYTDGIILVIHGGVKMGQGLHISINKFLILLQHFAISDMYGAAVLDACQQIISRMEPIISQHKFNTSAEPACYAETRDLSAHISYFTYGTAFTEA